MMTTCLNKKALHQSNGKAAWRGNHYQIVRGTLKNPEIRELPEQIKEIRGKIREGERDGGTCTEELWS
jgi:hypothetical protein